MAWRSLYSSRAELTPALQFIWGGRNDSAYMEDGWLFHLANNTWEEVLADETVHQPRGRDHMGAFYFDGAVYMYGELQNVIVLRSCQRVSWKVCLQLVTLEGAHLSLQQVFKLVLEPSLPQPVHKQPRFWLRLRRLGPWRSASAGFCMQVAEAGPAMAR